MSLQLIREKTAVAKVYCNFAGAIGKTVGLSYKSGGRK